MTLITWIFGFINGIAFTLVVEFVILMWVAIRQHRRIQREVAKDPMPIESRMGIGINERGEIVELDGEK